MQMKNVQELIQERLVNQKLVQGVQTNKYAQVEKQVRKIQRWKRLLKNYRM